MWLAYLSNILPTIHVGGQSGISGDPAVVLIAHGMFVESVRLSSPADQILCIMHTLDHSGLHNSFTTPMPPILHGSRSSKLLVSACHTCGRPVKSRSTKSTMSVGGCCVPPPHSEVCHCTSAAERRQVQEDMRAAAARRERAERLPVRNRAGWEGVLGWRRGV